MADALGPSGLDIGLAHLVQQIGAEGLEQAGSASEGDDQQGNPEVTEHIHEFGPRPWLTDEGVAEQSAGVLPRGEEI